MGGKERGTSMRQQIRRRWRCFRRGGFTIALAASWVLLPAGVEADERAALVEDLSVSISASLSDEVPAELWGGDGEDAGVREERVEKVRAALLDELEAAAAEVGR